MKRDFKRISFCYLTIITVLMLAIIPVFAQEQDPLIADDEFTSDSADTDNSADMGDSTATESVPVDAAASQEEPSMDDVDDSGNVTLDFKDADILLVLRLLSLKSGVNIVAGPEVSGTITIRLNDVPWEKALDVVLRTYGYVYERDSNIIRVTTKESLAAEELLTEAFVLNYSTATEIEDAISEIVSERGRIKSVPRTNTILVTDVATNIYKIGEIIRRLDKRTPQVFIDSKVVRTAQQNIEQLGINWNAAGTLTGAARPTTFPFNSNGNFDFLGKDMQERLARYYPEVNTTESTTADSSSGGSETTSEFPTGNPIAFPYTEQGEYAFGTLDFTAFQATLNLLKSRSSTKIISNPRIVTLSNQEAKVQVGQEIGIPTFERNETSGSFEVTGFESRDVGVVLRVTPHVNDANEILVHLTPEVSSFDGFQDIGTTNLAYPVFTTTEATTQVLIKDNETIAIGGLLTDAETTVLRKVPVLGDIPFVGKLFRSKVDSDNNNKVETLFFITVTIINTVGQPEYVAIGSV